MARKVAPYHSLGGTRHHVYSDCSLGNNIERDKRKRGTGGKPMCSRCRDIASGKASR